MIPRERARWVYGLATAITVSGALGAALHFREPLARWYRGRIAGVPALAAAASALPYRTIEGRFMGGFAYKPMLLRRKDDSGIDDPAHARLRLLAARANEVLLHNRAPNTIHAAAVAHTLLGAHDVAVQNFRDALALETGVDDVGEGIRKCINPALLSDLAAAFQARGRALGEPRDFLIALDAAERAAALSSTDEATWNRALALDSLNLGNEAREAWESALVADPDSPWNGYVRERIRVLSSKTRSEQWAIAKPRLLTAVGSGASADVGRIVRQFPQEARTLVEEELLPAWGEAMLIGDGRSAQENLAAAGSIGAALADSGEQIVRDTVLALQQRGGRAAKAVVTYRLAMRRYRAQAMSDARALWLEVAKELDDAGIPLAQRAAVFEATTTYYAGDSQGAVARVNPIADDRSLRTRYPTIVAQALWVRALVLGTRGHEEEAIRDTHLAIELFARANELENLAIMQARLATFTDYVGDSAQSWQQRIAALESFAAYGESVRFQSLLLDVARASGEAGLVHATLRLQDAHVRIAQHGGDSAGISAAHRLRSLARWRAGLANDAIADIRAAEAAAAKVPDVSMRERLMANVASTSCSVLRMTDPAAAVMAGTKAIEFFERVENRLRLIDSYLDRALALDAVGDRAAVSADLARASRELELQRSRLRGIGERRDFLERWRTLFDVGISLFAARGDYATALAFAEETRARGLLDVASGKASTSPWDVAAIAARIPVGTTLIVYAALPDRLIIWTVRRNEVHGQIENVSRAQLREELRRLTHACGSRQAQCDEEFALAYRRFLRPVRARLSERLIIVPDDLLAQVPFAALRQAPTLPYLVESHEIVIASSATVYARREADPSRIDPETSVVLIGNPAHDRTAPVALPDLPAAAIEVRQIAELYKHPVVLTGEAATKRAFLDAAQNSTLIHYAGHVITDAAPGSPAALVLAPDKRGKDGRLTADEVLKHGLGDVRLLVLSACGTSRRVAGADGPMGFARVFRLAGVQTVVAAIAPVDDDATQAFFTAFHGALLGSGDPSAALRSAQLSLIRGRPEFRAPSAWSRFVVII